MALNQAKFKISKLILDFTQNEIIRVGLEVL